MAITVQNILDILSSVNTNANISNIDPDKPITDYGLDSLDMMNLYFQIEEKLGVSVNVDENTDTSQLLSINQIIEYCNK